MPGTEHGRPHISLGQNTCRGKQCQQCRNQLASVSVPPPHSSCLHPARVRCNFRSGLALSTASNAQCADASQSTLEPTINIAVWARAGRAEAAAEAEAQAMPEPVPNPQSPLASRHASDSDGLIRSGTRARAGTGIGRGTAMGGYCCHRCLHLAVSCHVSTLRPSLFPPLLPLSQLTLLAVLLSIARTVGLL